MVSLEMNYGKDDKIDEATQQGERELRCYPVHCGFPSCKNVKTANNLQQRKKLQYLCKYVLTYVNKYPVT